jgi:hypothetical protein
MATKIKVIEFLQRLQGLPKESEEFARLLKGINDGRIDIDSQTKSFLAESCRALGRLSGDTGAAEHDNIAEAVFCLILYKDDEEFAVIDYPLKDGRFEFAHILPAVYTLKTSTGLLLWQKRLKQKDLFIGKSSQKDGRFRMAADSGDGGSVGSLVEELADGTMTLSVYAGFEDGRIELISETHRE